MTRTYSDQQLEAMMADIESELVERKESLTETPAKKDGPIEKIRQAVCAFANDLPGHRRPGVVFVGDPVDHGDHAPAEKRRTGDSRRLRRCAPARR